VVAGAAVVVLVMILAAFAALIRAQASGAERALDERFLTRAELTATFTREYIDELASRQRVQAEQLLSGPAVDEKIFDQVVASMAFEAAVLLDGAGRLLQVWPHKPALIGSDMTLEYAHLRAAVEGRVGVSGLVPSAAGRVPVTAVAVPFTAQSGRRVFSGAFTPGTTPLGAYFRATVPIAGGAGYLIDGSGNVLNDHGLPASSPVWLAEVDEGVSRFTHGTEDYTAAVEPVTGTSWRVVLTAPTSALHEPVSARQWAPWLVWGAFAGAGLAAVGLLRRLSRARAEASATAHTDALTGLPNRRAMQEILDRAAAQATRRSQPLSVLLIDLDHFKRVNDNYGHKAGDGVLQSTAEALRVSTRSEDAAGRWGGEEFIVVLPQTDLDGALLVAERIRRAIRNGTTISGERSITVTASVGLATLVDQADSLLPDADAALYQAKANGRDRVVAADVADIGRSERSASPAVAAPWTG
jgi:diguanylate cyclase (GGDEF)-like protein